jgi:hypothetical protein
MKEEDMAPLWASAPREKIDHAQKSRETTYLLMHVYQ